MSKNSSFPSSSIKSFVVRVDVPKLRIRKSPSMTAEPREETLRPGRYTVVDVEYDGATTNGFGLLKDYESTRDGWISLDFTTRV